MCNTDLLSWLVLRNIEDHIAMFHFWDHNNTIIPKTNEQTIIVWNLYLWTGIGPVRLSYNSYFSACFFSWNNIFLSQQISWNNIFAYFFSEANGAAPVFVACNLILGSFSLPVGCAWRQISSHATKHNSERRCWWQVALRALVSDLDNGIVLPITAATK